MSEPAPSTGTQPDNRRESHSSGTRELLAMISPAGPWAIRVAATLRLADLIASGISRLDDLAAAAGVNGDALERLLAFLTSRGIFSTPEPRRFGVNAAARLLKDDHPAHLRQWLDLGGAGGRMDATWPALLESIRTGKPVYAGEHGGGFWEDLARDKDLAYSFNALMANVSAEIRSNLAQAYDWSSVESLVDVGGGNGALLRVVLGAYPHLKATLVELPAAAQIAETHLTEAGLRHRCTIVTGSFFDPLPVGADVYVLANVLHDWNDEDASRIMACCAGVAGPDGRILVVERVRSDANARTSTEDDLRFLMIFGGRARSFAQFNDLAARAKFIPRSTRSLSSGVALMEFVRGPSRSLQAI
jgi:2,7-dihydroxy-5-methyl-1-naphthoate 7-O-methyltransferase